MNDETRLGENIEALERRETMAARVAAGGFIAAARRGLVAYMEVAVGVAAELLKRDLEAQVQNLSGEARRLLEALGRHDQLIARVEQATGQPARIPRVRHGAHEALVALGITATVELLSEADQQPNGGGSPRR